MPAYKYLFIASHTVNDDILAMVKQPFALISECAIYVSLGKRCTHTKAYCIQYLFWFRWPQCKCLNGIYLSIA